MALRSGLLPIFGFLATVIASASGLAAVDGKVHSAVAPTFDGTGGNLSYIRFMNTSTTATSTYTVTIVGSPSGRSYGTTTYTVPPRASFQRHLTEIMAQANAGALTGGDTAVSFYLKNPDSGAAFQHVIFNDTTRFFENVSLCQFFRGAQYFQVIQWLPNVHTTRLSAFPMRINIHNFDNVPGNYRVNLYNADTGVKIGDTVVTVAANQTLSLQESSLEQTLGFTPEPSQLHTNVFIEPVGSGTFNAVISAIVFNAALNASVNVSTMCRVMP